MASRTVLNNLELTHMIFQWLKAITLEQEEVDIEDDDELDIPTSWTRHFARLTTVNGAFFHASIEVLWERLASPMPLFGYVLPADKDNKGIPKRSLSYQTHELTIKHWDRFKLYSSRIKVLVLRNSSSKMTSSWMSHLLHSENRPHTLLPSLKRLFLAAQTPLALYITYNSIPHVGFIEVGVSQSPKSDPREVTKSLLTGIRRNAGALTSLRMKQVATPDLISDVSRLLSLTSLSVKIGGMGDSEYLNAGAFDLGQLAELPFLRALTIREDVDENDPATASIMPTNAIDIQGIVKQKAKFTELRKLRVEASGMTQYRLAMALLPAKLETLDLVVVRDILNVQVVLIPLVVTIYARRNSSLNYLAIDMDSGSDLGLKANEISLSPYRRSLQYSNPEQFLEAISGLHRLTYFALRDVSVLDVKLVPKLLKVLSRFPLLKVMAIEPNAITDLDTDELSLPTLEVLQEIALAHPNLEHLGLTVDLTEDVPHLSEDIISKHGLQTVGLYVYHELEYSEEKKLNLVRYLEILFPHVRIDISAFGEDYDDAEFWTSVDRLLRFSRQSRDRVRRQLLEKGEA